MDEMPHLYMCIFFSNYTALNMLYVFWEEQSKIYCDIIQITTPL